LNEDFSSQDLTKARDPKRKSKEMGRESLAEREALKADIMKMMRKDTQQ
jgi:hypothetical protein